eukprot:34892-Amphidinium_carterae.1
MSPRRLTLQITNQGQEQCPKSSSLLYSGYRLLELPQVVTPKGSGAAARPDAAQASGSDATI